MRGVLPQHELLAARARVHCLRLSLALSLPLVIGRFALREGRALGIRLGRERCHRGDGAILVEGDINEM